MKITVKGNRRKTGKRRTGSSRNKKDVPKIETSS